MLRFQRLPSFRSTSLHTDVGAPPPDAFGPYRVLHQVGIGILGPVFRAYDPDRDRLVAVKLFRLDQPPDRAHRLVAELEQLVSRRIEHPAIVAPLAAGLADTSAYLVTDFVSADASDVYFRGRTQRLGAEVRRVVAPVVEALSVACAAGVQHGSLHPRDILVGEDDVRLNGLGIAQAFERAGLSVSVRRPYASPERLAGEPWTTVADVFSVAALSFEFLAGKRITGLGADAAAALPEIEGVQCEALRGLFARALAAHPGERFATVGEFGQMLDTVLGGEAIGLPAVRISRRGRRAAPRPPAPPVVEPPRESSVEPAAVPAAERPEHVEHVAHPEQPAVEPVTRVVPDAAFGVPSGLPVDGAPAAPALDPLDDKLWRSTPRIPVPPEALPTPASTDVAAALLGAAVSNTAVWPLLLALVVGVAIGFAGGYATAGRRVATGVLSLELPGEVTAEGAAPAKVSSVPAGQDIQLTALARPAAQVASNGAEPALQPARDPAPKRAGLIISSRPAGGRVFVDGSLVGTTPLTLTRLSAGRHDVRIEREGYKPWSRAVTAVAGGRRRVAASLAR